MTDESGFRFHSWNANGIDEFKIRSMMASTWVNSDLILIQETKLNPSKEKDILKLLK